VLTVLTIFYLVLNVLFVVVLFFFLFFSSFLLVCHDANQHDVVVGKSSVLGELRMPAAGWRSVGVGQTMPSSRCLFVDPKFIQPRAVLSKG
jgi:hypothetical protein